MLNFENALSFKAGQEPDVALRNFWAPEGTWVWSTGRWAEINFAFDLGVRAPVGTAEIIMDLDVFKHEEKHPGQNVLVFLNGLRIGSLYCTHRVTFVFAFDARILTRAENVLTLDTPDAIAPSAFGDPDGRVLGVQLFSAQIRRAL